MATWRELYHDEIERQAGFFEKAREIGQTWLVVDGRTHDPTRMSREQVRRVATREAERLINYTINQENEAARKAGRVTDKE